MKQQALRAMERDLRVILDEVSGPEASKVLAATWRKAHDEVMQAAQRRKGVPPSFVVAVDNDRNKALETARNIIVSNYDYRREIVMATIDALDKASPRKSGDYVRAHTIFVNGKAVGKVCPPLSETDTVFIANPLPYARRLEVGKTKSGRTFVLHVPPRIYERVYKEIRSIYRDISSTKFGYVDLSNAYVVTGGMQQRTPRYATGEVRKQTQTHWIGTGSDGTPAHWQTFEKGGAKTRIRRQKTREPVRAPAIHIFAVN